MPISKKYHRPLFLLILINIPLMSLFAVTQPQAHQAAAGPVPVYGRDRHAVQVPEFQEPTRRLSLQVR